MDCAFLSDITVNQFMRNKKTIVPPLLKDSLRKPPFPNDIQQLEGIDPTFDTQADFDWRGLEELLGEAEQLQESDRALLADVLHKIIAWCVECQPGKLRLDLLGRKIVALAWLVSPEFFEGASLSKLARRAGLKNNKYLAQYSGQASRTFNLRNHAQSHAHNFQN